MMLAREFRLTEKEKIEEVKNKGKIIQSDSFGVSKLKKEPGKTPRFAFVISTKISKLAVHRNRINRAMHEGVRRILKYVEPGYDFVFLAKRSISGKTTEEIIREVEKFFSGNVK